ncbi:hypothetical protein SLA2020_495830 [Shorea laevis]
MAEFIIQLYGNLGEYLSFSLSSFLKHIFFYKNAKKTSEPIVYGRWHQLPEDMMEVMILQRLNLIDRIRLGGVCKSWRSVVKQKHILTAPSLPWLLLPHGPNCKSLSFFSMSEGIVRSIKLPKAAQGGWCFGSSRGWLTIARGTEVFVFNPLSGFQHQLPSLTTIPSFNDYVNVVWDPNRLTSFILKIELSSTNPSECIVAATFIAPPAQLLAFCKLGDKEWSVFQGLKEKSPFYFDIRFHEDKLYALVHMMEGAFATTYTMELANREVIILKVIPNIGYRVPLINEAFVDIGDIGIIEDKGLKSHLVESDGELLIVGARMDVLYSTIFEEEEEEEDEQLYGFIYLKTSKFDVFKIGCSRGTLPYTRLTSLSGKMLFVSESESLSLSTPDFNGFTGNSIYFLEHSNYYLQDHDPKVSRESGVFYLDDERTERSFLVSLFQRSVECVGLHHIHTARN